MLALTGVGYLNKIEGGQTQREEVSKQRGLGVSDQRETIGVFDAKPNPKFDTNGKYQNYLEKSNI